MKTGFIVLPFWMLTGAALAQDAERPVEQPAPVAEVPAAGAAAQAPTPAKVAPPQRRQGADMRHCLEQKDNLAIIRCAEPGRRP